MARKNDSFISFPSNGGLSKPSHGLKIKKSLISQCQLPSNYLLNPRQLRANSDSILEKRSRKFSHQKTRRFTAKLLGFLLFMCISLQHGAFTALQSILTVIQTVWYEVYYLAFQFTLKLYHAFLWTRYYTAYRIKRKTFKAAGLTFVLDLDETLVHTTLEAPPSRFVERCSFSVEGYDGERYYVYKRPHLEIFLSILSRIGKVILFTAAERYYAEKVLGWVDKKGYISAAFFRESCTKLQRGYLKSLRQLGYDLTRTVVIDDCPTTYQDNPENALPIQPWDTRIKNDKALLELLDQLHCISLDGDDVRQELAKLRSV